MKVEFSKNTKYVDITPNIAFGWYSKEKILYIGWLFWNIVVTI